MKGDSVGHVRKCRVLLSLAIVMAVVPSRILVGASSYSWSSSASFVPPAAPPAATEVDYCGPPVSVIHAATTSSSRGLSPLSMAKKKKGGAPPASKKVQVKLLKQVAGTGQKGDVVMVSPAFFQNKLRPSKAAEIISDEQYAQEQSEAAAEEQAIQEQATELQTTLQETTLVISRKAGPDGQLFGGVGAKTILEELKKQLDDIDFFLRKGVKITAITDGNGKKMRGDIKHTGDFGATIALTKDISAKLEIKVQDES